MEANHVSAIVEKRIFPYRTKGDLMRHALHRHLHWLESLGSGVPSITAQVDALMSILVDDERASVYRASFDKLGDRIAYYVGVGEVNQGRRLLLEVLSKIEGMPESYWKSRYIQEVKDNHGGLLDKKLAASLSRIEAS